MRRTEKFTERDFNTSTALGCNKLRKLRFTLSFKKPKTWEFGSEFRPTIRREAKRRNITSNEKAYASSRGWKVVEVYDLAGQSGKAVMQHPEAMRRMADVKRGDIHALLFSKLARLSPNIREVQDFSEFYRVQGADLVSLAEAIDTSTAGGRMYLNLLTVFARMGTRRDR